MHGRDFLAAVLALAAWRAAASGTDSADLAAPSPRPPGHIGGMALAQLLEDYQDRGRMEKLQREGKWVAK